MKLNCDLGESFGHWRIGQDERVMPFIDMANIACGFHAGDPVVMQKTLSMAVDCGVEIGAHPSYPDLQGFGRRSMHIPADELTAILHYQIAALEGMARVKGASLSYVKPHGALYNDMMANDELMHTIMQAVQRYSPALSLLIQATSRAQEYASEARRHGLSLRFEAFADRQYMDDGSLMPRNEAGAVLDKQAMLLQARSLIEAQSVQTASGAMLKLNADTLCVHGDNDEALIAVKAIRKMLGD